MWLKHEHSGGPAPTLLWGACVRAPSTLGICQLCPSLPPQSLVLDVCQPHCLSQRDGFWLRWFFSPAFLFSTDWFNLSVPQLLTSAYPGRCLLRARAVVAEA